MNGYERPPLDDVEVINGFSNFNGFTLFVGLIVFLLIIGIGAVVNQNAERRRKEADFHKQLREYNKENQNEPR